MSAHPLPWPKVTQANGAHDEEGREGGGKRVTFHRNALHQNDYRLIIDDEGDGNAND